MPRLLTSFQLMAAGVLTILGPVALIAQDSGANLTIEQKEEFLRTAKAIADKPNKQGITGTHRVTLTDGKVTHDANVEQLDEHKDVFQTADGATELNFKDSYKFNIAAWKLARLLGLDDMMPPYRLIRNQHSVTLTILRRNKR